jgi:hypothetical protein
MPLGQPNTGIVCDERTVIEPRRRQAQSSIQQQLARRGPQEIFSADDLTDSHLRIINHNCQLVGGHVIVPPDDEITEILPCYKLLLSATAIDERNDLAIGHAKTPVDGTRRHDCLSAITIPLTPTLSPRIGGMGTGFERTALAGINWFIFADMRRGQGTKNILAGTGARIDEATGLQPLERRPIK